MDRVSRRALLGAAGASVALAAVGRRVHAADIEGITAKDPANMTKMEQKHVPKITVGEAKAGEPVTVTIDIGAIDHPMAEEHFIEWIDVYLDGKKLSRITLTPVAMKAAATVTLTPEKSGMLTVSNKCNLHGIYKSCVEIKA